MKRIIWAASFFLGAPAIMVLSLFLLSSLQKNAPIPTPIPQVLSTSTHIYSPSYSTGSSVYGKVTIADGRSIIIKNYLDRYSSPLSPHASDIVQISDKYSLDYRLLVAIARQESNLCKRIPDNSYNCWGFGIYGDKVTRFDNYPQALETVAKTLKRDYIDKGLDTPEKIMAKYTPPSVEIGGPWAKGVSQFMSELE